MGNLTLADMRQAIVRNIGGTMTTEYDISMPNPLLTTVINECLQTIDSERDWPWNTVEATLTTAANDNTYDPPSGWMRTMAIVDPDRGPLEYVSYNNLATWWPDVTDTAANPLWYTEVAGHLDLRPTPSAVLALKHVYYSAEPELVDDTDEPLLPNRFRPRLIAMATAEIAARNDDWAKQQRYQNMDPAYAKRMQDDARRVTARTGIRIRTGTWNA